MKPFRPLTVTALLALLSVVFVPAAQAKGSATVWAVGDGADGGQATLQVGQLVERGKPDKFLYLGDVYETGTALEFTSNYAPAFGTLAPKTAPTPGNHEWGLRAEGYFPYWRGVLGRDLPEYYKFSLAGWEIFSLNSEGYHGPRSKQVRWLRSKLKKKGTCRVAFWHRPRYSGGGNGDQADVAPLWKALKKKAAIVLAGHDHHMQRLKPKDGITEFISGAGGNPLHPVWKDPRVVFRNNTVFGALRLKLSRGLARYAFVAVDGRTLDSGKVRCRRGKSR
jgi:calcineurin-like phosphoesterase family protein